MSKANAGKGKQEGDVTPVDAADATTAADATVQPSDTAALTDATADTQEKTPQPRVTTADKVKFGILIGFFLLVITGSIFVITYISSIGTEAFETDLEQVIEDAGPYGVLICFLMQFIQVIVTFIPGEIMQFVIGYLYGTLWGGLIICVSTLIPTILVFYLSRKLGAPFVQGMTGNKENKWLRFLRKSKNVNSLAFILYLIPGMPKDFFSYFFPLTDIRPSAFFVLTTIARIPAIFASTFVSTSFRSGDYLQMVIVAVIFGSVAILGIVFNQKLMVLVDKLVTRISPRHHDSKDEA